MKFPSMFSQESERGEDIGLGVTKGTRVLQCIVGEKENARRPNIISAQEGRHRTSADCWHPRTGYVTLVRFLLRFVMHQATTHSVVVEKRWIFFPKCIDTFTMCIFPTWYLQASSTLTIYPTAYLPFDEHHIFLTHDSEFPLLFASESSSQQGKESHVRLLFSRAVEVSRVSHRGRATNNQNPTNRKDSSKLVLQPEQ